jgi:hypothetical protein
MLMGMVMGVVHALGHFIIDLLTDIFNWIGSLF